MPPIDDVNGLMYMAMRWIAHASLLDDQTLERLARGLDELANEYAGDDACALRALATASRMYKEHK
jgi:hypothetical protein